MSEKVYRAIADGQSEEVTLPEFECFKRVRAAKIVALGIGRAEKTMRLGLEGGAHVEVSHAWVSNKLPQVGGYFVQYEDGYSSYSPAKAFEEGYLLVPAKVSEAEQALPSAEDLDAAAAEVKATEETAPATETEQQPVSENGEPGPEPVEASIPEAIPLADVAQVLRKDAEFEDVAPKGEPSE